MAAPTAYSNFVSLSGTNIPAGPPHPLAVSLPAQYTPYTLTSPGYWSIATVRQFENVTLGPNTPPAGEPPYVAPPYLYTLSMSGVLTINTALYPLSLATPPVIIVENGIFGSRFASLNPIQTVGGVTTWDISLTVVRNTCIPANQGNNPTFTVVMADLGGQYSINIQASSTLLAYY